jgi:hypothetical protein
MLLAPDLRIVDTTSMPWEPSPAAGVWRRRLELSGDPERGRVTSIVRYEAGRTFPRHAHPDGEEILVLAGVFSDDEGDHPAGTILLNPPGSAHSPRSIPGCRLFVKLRYYTGDRPQIRVDTNSATWQASTNRGVHRLPIYAQRERGDRQAAAIDILRLNPGADLPPVRGGREILIIAGELVSADQTLDEETWIRDPAGSYPLAAGSTGATIYCRRGHL